MPLLESEKKMPKQPMAGPLVGGLIGLVACGAIVFLFTKGDHVGGVYIAVLLGVYVLAPLLVLNLVLSVIYLRRGVPAPTFGWMWGPIAAVGFLIMLRDGFSEQKRRSDEAEHPVIREVHVNLSGHRIWFDPAGKGGDPHGAVVLPGDPPGALVELSRYFGDDDTMAIYAKARLAPSFHEMTVFREPPPKGHPRMLPAIWRADAFPDVSSFIQHLSFQGGEASVVVYWFFHYPDRVDVIPAIDLAGSQSMDLWGHGVPVVDFHIANLGRWPIARLEIDGATLALGSATFAPEQADGNGCSSRNYAGYAVNHLQAPLKVRWQWAQANPAWHEALVEVPPFRTGQLPRGRPRSTSVELYFQADGSVVAERSQVRDLPRDGMSIHTTGPARPLASPPPCGYAPDRYGESVKVIRD